MTYLFLYLIGVIIIFYVYKVGWLAALKTVISIIVPSFLIILFNVKAGRLLFKSPIVGLVSALPTSIFIFRGSKPLVLLINNWIENKFNFIDIQEDVIDTESYTVDEQ
tara:strand:+ start:1149 stop:1472 length:324 start_codon:yes stop_codon:yes gene_type:complete